MKLRMLGVIVGTLLLSACGTGITNKAPKQLTLVIENAAIQPILVLSESEQLDVLVKNNTSLAQILKIQGLKINFVTPSIPSQTSQSFHFQIEQNKGALNITSTNEQNQVQNINVNIN